MDKQTFLRNYNELKNSGDLTDYGKGRLHEMEKIKPLIELYEPTSIHQEQTVVPSREMIAAMFGQGLVSNHSAIDAIIWVGKGKEADLIANPDVAKYAVRFADNLLAELNKKPVSETIITPTL